MLRYLNNHIYWRGEERDMWKSDPLLRGEEEENSLFSKKERKHSGRKTLPGEKNILIFETKKAKTGAMGKARNVFRRVIHHYMLHIGRILNEKL